MNNGSTYQQSVEGYLSRRFSARATINSEVTVGRSLHGKKRKVDILMVSTDKEKALAIECKFQDVAGTAEEKLHFAIKDLEAMPMPAVLSYAGRGFSHGVRAMLEASQTAAYCAPWVPVTWELDHLIGMHFGWFDLLLDRTRPVNLELFDSDKSA
tara:strand:- start:2630 stop:3094 length:465 start_codon:yes stop_codon:yes gene_type:complete